MMAGTPTGLPLMSFLHIVFTHQMRTVGLTLGKALTPFTGEDIETHSVVKIEPL